MQFQVPQFIDVEDKIFGPLSFRQFIIFIGSGIIAFVLYKYAPRAVFYVVAIPIGGLGAALIFVKVNGRSLSYAMQSGIRFYSGSRLYLWKREQKPFRSSETSMNRMVDGAMIKNRLNERRLGDLAWSLDVHGGKAPQ